MLPCTLGCYLIWVPVLLEKELAKDQRPNLQAAGNNLCKSNKIYPGVFVLFFFSPGFIVKCKDVLNVSARYMTRCSQFGEGMEKWSCE